MDQAYHWLVDEDTVILDMESGSSLPALIERYVLAVLYLSTDGPNWSSQVDFLTNKSLFNWTVQGDNLNVANIKGVVCNSQGHVTHLTLSTSKRFKAWCM